VTQLLLLIITVATLGVMTVLGRWPERAVALVLVVVLVITPWLEPYTIGTLRWAVALSSLGLFAVLLGLGMAVDRWWLLAAAGCQFVAVSTYLAAMMRPDALFWSAVTIRWVVWLELMIIALLGVWEARSQLPGLEPRNERLMDL